ncbi:MAG: DUF3806 domain-containing protein [Thermoanaerobaculia bacterium]
MASNRDLSAGELEWLRETKQYMLDLLVEEFGHVEFSRSPEDLVPLQRWFDLYDPEPDQLLDLQGIGVVLGNTIAASSTFEWSFVSNEFGDMIALRNPESGFVLYPIGMISKRVEDGRQVDLRALFDECTHRLQS